MLNDMTHTDTYALAQACMHAHTFCFSKQSMEEVSLPILVSMCMLLLEQAIEHVWW